MDAKDYISENDRILNEWQEAFVKNGGKEYQFSYDGIMFKGQIHRENGEDSNWIHSSHGNENKLWADSKRRILFLTKDQNTEDGCAWDTKIESYHHINHNIEEYHLAGGTFVENLVRALYGLLKVSPKSEIGFDDFTKEQALKTVDEAIFARINCKKEAGTKQCTLSELSKHMSEYKEYLCRQIKNLDADVLICCGNKNSENYIMDFLNEQVGYHFSSETENDSYDIHFDPISNKIAIDSFHLSYFMYPRKKMYNEIVHTFYSFLKNHPEFDNPVR